MTADASPTDPAHLARQLRARVRGDVSVDPMTRGLHATDASHYQIMPACVVAPRDAADAAAAVAVAAGLGLPITPRGGGTSLSGQTHGTGMVLDCSKYMDQVLAIDVARRTARVQPGVVRDRLNAQLAPHGLQFSPDPATGNRATVGGMIGNNASGTRSILYGKTSDKLIACTLALADGTVVELGPCDKAAWSDRAAGGGRAAELHRGVGEVVRQHRAEIERRFPRVMRRVSGYNLDAFLGDADETPWNLATLIAGSEGTLGVLLEATIQLDTLPAATALCVAHFDDAIASLKAVGAMLEHGPSAVEMLDATVLDEARVNRATRDMAGFIEGTPRAIQVVEFFGETPEAAAAKAHALAEDLRARGTGYAWPVLTDPAGQANVWNVRKLGLGLISNVKGPVKGQAFIEDACVPITVLPQYIERVLGVCEEYGVQVTLYAHASVGVLHVRPALDLHLAEDVAKMKAIADRCFEMVVGYGGAWAGEHGDGLVRGEFIRRFFGEAVYAAFRQVKALFDPGNLMNPGKIIDPAPMTRNLRYQPGQYRIGEFDSHYHYRDQGGFAAAVEQCNGVGACRKVGSGTMCPSYMGTRDEEASTRGRANALRLAMSGQMGDVKKAMSGDRLDEVLDLCLACKACKSECPNAVDMAKLKSDVLQMRHDAHGTPLGARLMGDSPTAARRIAGPLAPVVAPVVNFVQGLSPWKALLEKFTGIDRRRPLPRFAATPLQKRLKGRGKSHPLKPRSAAGPEAAGRGSDPHQPSAIPHQPSPRPRVVLFDDTYANFFEPEVGLAAVDLLEACGYEVIVARAGCCQRPRLSKGMVRAAKRDGLATLRNLDRYASEGLPIVFTEPSCASSIADDLPDLIDDAALGRRVSQSVRMIDVFLAEQEAAGRLPVKLVAKDDARDVLLHGHCHQKALFGTGAMKSLYAAMDSAACEEVDSGCCGMAGSFGYDHHDLSMRIGEQRLFPAVRAAIEAGRTIVAPGFSCRHQIADACGVRPRHWVQTVSAAPADPADPQPRQGR